MALVVLWGADGDYSPRFIEGLGLSGKAVMLAAAGSGTALVLGVILALARKVRELDLLV